MSKAIVMGIRRIEYTSKKTGKDVRGYELHYAEPKYGIIGNGVESRFCGDDICSELVKACAGQVEKLINQRVDIGYNSSGRIDYIRPAAQ